MTSDSTVRLPGFEMRLPADLARRVSERLAQLDEARFGDRLWRKDASLWSPSPEEQAAIGGCLGWLDSPKAMTDRLGELDALRADLLRSGIRRVVHMGMGGSSLAPLTFERSFPAAGAGPALHVLDTTDPATVLGIRRGAPLSESLFVVASKSGTTAEPLAFGQYFFHELSATAGADAGRHMAAITDPGSLLERQARERGYRAVLLNDPTIGGRYSALSCFGLAPAALMGIDVGTLLARAAQMAEARGPGVRAADNPGVLLGAALGEMGRLGRDKVTLVLPPPLSTFGMWIEQLLAESTGKGGRGLLPVAGEALGNPLRYGADRVFVHILLRGELESETQERVDTLAEAGFPVLHIELDDRLDLGGEFLRWEVATATAGAVLGINPFDQPNVAESKANTNRLLDVARREGRLPQEEPMLAEVPLTAYANQPASSLVQMLRGFVGSARPGDYIAFLAYLTEGAETDRKLQAIRMALRDRLRLATTVGTGPRYLHSTGQYHKGGPDTGLYILLTADDAEDVQIPGQPVSFGVFRRAQALGDLEALRRHGRRALRVHLGADVSAGLDALALALGESAP